MKTNDKLDAIDKHILEVLQKNARISNLELANAVNLSPTPCARRVKQLEDAGIIQRHVTILDKQKLGLTLTIYLAVTMEKHTPESFATFEKAIKSFPEVVSCCIVTGRTEDYLLKIVAKDMKHYEHFLLSKINKIAGVSNVHTSFELRSVIETGALPLD